MCVHASLPAKKLNIATKTELLIAAGDSTIAQIGKQLLFDQGISSLAAKN